MPSHLVSTTTDVDGRRPMSPEDQWRSFEQAATNLGVRVRQEGADIFVQRPNEPESRYESLQDARDSLRYWAAARASQQRGPQDTPEMPPLGRFEQAGAILRAFPGILRDFPQEMARGVLHPPPIGVPSVGVDQRGEWLNALMFGTPPGAAVLGPIRPALQALRHPVAAGLTRPVESALLRAGEPGARAALRLSGSRSVAGGSLEAEGAAARPRKPKKGKAKEEAEEGLLSEAEEIAGQESLEDISASLDRIAALYEKARLTGKSYSKLVYELPPLEQRQLPAEAKPIKVIHPPGFARPTRLAPREVTEALQRKLAERVEARLEAGKPADYVLGTKSSVGTADYVLGTKSSVGTKPPTLSVGGAGKKPPKPPSGKKPPGPPAGEELPVPPAGQKPSIPRGRALVKTAPPPVKVAPPPVAAPPTSPAVAKLTQLFESYLAPSSAEQTARFARERAKRVGGAVGAAKAAPITKQEQAFFGGLKGPYERPLLKIPASELPTVEDIFEIKGLIRKTFQDDIPRSARTVRAFDRVFIEGRVLTPAETKNLAKVLGPETVDTLKRTRVRLGATKWEELVALANLPRSMRATFDLSAPLRQGVALGVANPREYRGAFKDMIKAAFSEEDALYLDGLTQSHPLFEQWIKDRGYHAPITQLAGAAAREEAYFLSPGERTVVGRLFGKVPLTRASERAYVTFLNRLRFQVYAKEIQQATRLGKPLDTIERQSLAKFLNAASGRGNVSGRLAELMPIFTFGLFSPRFQLSRLQTIYYLAKPNVPWAVRKMTIKTMAAYFASGATALALLDLSGLAEVEIDPRSPLFGRGRIGRTAFDIWGGFQPYAKWLAQSIMGNRKSPEGDIGEFPFLGRLYPSWRLTRTKLAPVAEYIADTAEGKTVTNQEFSWLSSEVLTRNAPFILQDTYDALADDILPVSLGASAFSFFGGGVETYEDLPSIFEQAKGPKSKKKRPLPGFRPRKSRLTP